MTPDSLRRLRRRAVAMPIAVAALALATGTVHAHPLGNFTVNRAVVIDLTDVVVIRYVIDMAEIPAFEEIQRIDGDLDGETDEDELNAYAADACEGAGGGLEIVLDGGGVVAGEARSTTVTFPPGAGGLETLRLECTFLVVPGDPGDTIHSLTITDHANGRLGWREVTARAVAPGAEIVESDVPEESSSELLTRYPENLLQSPVDVRAASIRFRTAPAAVSSPEAAPNGGPTTPRQTANDPLASLIGQQLTPGIAAGAVLLSLALGAVHAVSPGHGKTLMAAYFVGARGDARAAVTIGLTVAATHTAGVLILGLLTLLASEFILPERAIGWLSLASGLIVIVLGLVLVSRQLLQLAGRRSAVHEHGHDHGHAHDHEHPDNHAGTHSHTPPEDHLDPPPRGLTARSAVALGLAGGLVPSSSALIVLLVAITTDRVVFGSLLILAFGAGMALVLGGLGLAIVLGRRLAGKASAGWLTRPWVRAVVAAIPLVAGISVLVAGMLVTLQALPGAFG